MDFRVTPATEGDRDLVRAGVGVVSPPAVVRRFAPRVPVFGVRAPVRQVVFLDERASVVVCQSDLGQTAPPTLAPVGRRPVVRTALPRPV